MGTRYLIDSNIIIYFLDGKLTSKGEVFLKPLLQYECNISVITQIEVLGWKFLTPQDEQEAANFIQASTIFPLSDFVVAKTILLRKQLKFKLPDAVIAATALENNFTLVTRNTSDFTNIPSLQVVNPMI